MILLKLWNIQIFLCKKRYNIWLIWIIYEYDTVCINHEHDTFCINHEFFIIQHAYFIVSLQTLNSAWKERYKVIKIFLYSISKENHVYVSVYLVKEYWISKVMHSIWMKCIYYLHE